MNTESKVFFADGEDPAMQQAIKRARQTFRFFWRELSWEQRRIIPGLEVACVKVAFSDPPDESGEESAVEQMWINDVNFDGKHVTGTLVNSPNWLTSVSEGDEVSIRPGQLTDWLYAVMGNVYGAFTVNVMRAQMDPGERAQHDEAWGFEFGDPNIVRLVPSDFFTDGSGEGSQHPARAAEFEHPMALNMCESLEEHAKDPENLTAADENGFTILHQLALAGAAKGVQILLNHGADATARTQNGMTPLMLAKTLGWNQVVAVIEQSAT